MVRDRLAEIRARQAAGLPAARPEPPRSGWQVAPTDLGQATPRDFNPFAPDNDADYMSRRVRDLPPLPQPSWQAAEDDGEGRRGEVGESYGEPDEAGSRFAGRAGGTSVPLGISRSTSTGNTATSRRRRPPADYDDEPSVPPVPSSWSPQGPPSDFTFPTLSPNVAYLGSPPEAPLPRDFDPTESSPQYDLSHAAFPSTYSLPRARSPPIRSPPRDTYSPPPPPTGQRADAATAASSLPAGRRVPPVPVDTVPYSAQQRDYRPDKASTVDLVERDDSAERKGSTSRTIGQASSRNEVSHEDFYQEVSDLQHSLREANGNIQSVGDLHMRTLALPSSDDRRAIELRGQLEARKATTRTLFQELRDRLRALEQANANLRASVLLGRSPHTLSLADTDVREQQITGLKERVKAAIQRYGEAERDYRGNQRARLERQVKVVNPDMTHDEVAQAVKAAEESGDGAMFAQALQSNGARLPSARGVLREVQDRAAELARIEATLVELAELFQDMSVMVEAQDAVIDEVEHNAVKTELDTEKGLTHVKEAVVHARNYRKWRWLCFGLSLIILAIVVIVLCVKLIPKGKSAPAGVRADAGPINPPVIPVVSVTVLAARSTAAQPPPSMPTLNLTIGLPPTGKATSTVNGTAPAALTSSRPIVASTST